MTVHDKATGIRRPGAGIALAPGRLTRLRNEKTMTREELADDAGISLSALTKIENGERRPRPRTLRRLCEILGRDPADLIAGEEST